MHNFSDDKLYFDHSWYTEQILNSSIEGGNKMDNDNKENIGSDDIVESDDGEHEAGCCCCFCSSEEGECRLPANEWTDD
jgi:hypothetical protein